MIDDSDDLRSLDAVFQPDPRSGVHSIVEPRTLAVHRADVAKLVLHDGVPEDIRIQFLTACNLMLYSWFVYRFANVGELHAIATLEFALRERFDVDPSARPALKSMLKCAVDMGLLCDSGLREYQRRVDAVRRDADARAQWPEELQRLCGAPPIRPKPDARAAVKRLCTSIPALRNTLAHGSSYLWTEGCLRVEICADLINQLFSRPTTDEDVGGAA
ncbi:MAG: hypothetical protein IT454_00915 [Planctomycetes bacterium]|nr:hypothetical protein [Planctomycetota bacterium]